MLGAILLATHSYTFSLDANDHDADESEVGRTNSDRGQMLSAIHWLARRLFDRVNSDRHAISKHDFVAEEPIH